MPGKYLANNTTIVALILGVTLLQLLIVQKNVEAKHYRQPYGDIMPDEEDNSFQNERNAYDHRNGQTKRLLPHGKRYQKDFENDQYQTIDSNSNTRSNRNLAGHNLNGWITSNNVVEMQQDNITEQAMEDASNQKCKIWIPMDALDKYPDAEKRQFNKGGGSVLIEICCKGYAAMRWRGKTICRPVCDNCQNGRCIAPGMCQCYDEYVANDNGDCVFTCPVGCLNGRCYLDGSCQCDLGYKLDASRKFCRPICSKGCGTNQLHNCTEPEVCGCAKGFILTDNDCQPVCQHDCGAGGTCRQPDVCECITGSQLKDGICQADCYQKCDNGICVSRNRCICNPGFTYHERSTQCIPK